MTVRAENLAGEQRRRRRPGRGQQDAAAGRMRSVTA
jgi:hypothetical protein